ncbi:hypothetical protein OGH69_15215 [Flavobacterium sp. MFBS3-15]|uniref:hypothetical protein n=1 Tax=Flavobacterium sp. MFBS3-15 TaxID=2989816 RepID=UPI0022360CC0|nr:hypothetical protein [Flavobacterium sp. MFBS3-15]MCW4470323.1 hypothetical protein [Flavobacterium sp. MFBS3-15]
MKNLLVIFSFLFSMVSTAQDKFIEVEVEDTITLKPERFDIALFVASGSPYEKVDVNNSFNIKENEKRLTQNIDKVKHQLKAKSYRYKQDDTLTMYPPLSAPSGATIVVSLTSEKEWGELSKLLSQFDFVNATITKFKFLNESEAETMLYKKLVERAGIKADVIAAASGLIIRNVIAVKEAEGMDDFELNLHDTYFVGENSKKLQMQDGKLVGSLYKKLVVKFGVE